MGTEKIESKTKRTIKQKIRKLKKIVTVEPLIALYQMASFLSKPALVNLEFEKACRVNLKFNDTICEAILKGFHQNYIEQNNEIQVEISEMHSWQQPLQSIVPLILVLFIGSFSDRYKWRKPFFLLPIIGELIGVLGCGLCVKYMHLWPLEVQGVLQKVVPSLFGGQIMLVMATTSYIADISSIEMRTLRLGIVQIVISVTSPLMNSFNGVLFLKIGYISILSISGVMLLSAFSYGVFCIQEQPLKNINDKKCLMSNLFNLQDAVSTLTVILRKNPGISRKYILVIILVSFIHRSAFEGESDILFLYTQMLFQWTPVEYSFFLTINGLVLLIGNVAGLPLFTKIFHMSDLMILLVSIITKILTNLIFGLAGSPYIFYVGILVGVVTRMYRVAKKSLSTKIVSENDIGKTQSLLGICEAVAPALSVPIYNAIYVNTLTRYPATFFFFSIFLYLICCVLILVMFHREKQKAKQKACLQKNVTIIESIHM